MEGNRLLLHVRHIVKSRMYSGNEKGMHVNTIPLNVGKPNLNAIKEEKLRHTHTQARTNILELLQLGGNNEQTYFKIQN